MRLNKLKELLSRSVTWLDEIMRARDTRASYFLMFVALLGVFWYSFQHLVWYLDQFEPPGASNSVFGALGIEMMILGLSLALVRIQDNPKLLQKKKIIWTMFALFLLFTGYANFAHSASYVSGHGKIPTLEMYSRFSWLMWFQVAVYCWPPLGILACSYTMQLFAVHRQKPVVQPAPRRRRVEGQGEMFEPPAPARGKKKSGAAGQIQNS